MKLDVKGNSGCSIKITEEDNRLFVLKSSLDPSYFDRLIKQGEKQQRAYDSFSADDKTIIKVPKVFDIYRTDDAANIKMCYVHAKNFISFFESASATDIDNFISALINYINAETESCKIEQIDYSVFVKKLLSIQDNIKYNNLVLDKDFYNILILNLIDRLKEFGTLELPIGICHGDLTFSNVLFTNTNYYLIDFLDSYVETPLQDIVKIRQDSKFMWSTMMYTKKYDNIRMRFISEYIDKKIDKYFSKYEWYKKYYNIIQMINLLRILPYVKEERVYKFLDNAIRELCMP